MRLPRAYFVIQHLVDAYVALLLALVIAAVLIPPVASAREAARRAVCTHHLRLLSGLHPDDVVCLKQGRIVWVSSCRCCGSVPGIRIRFVEEKDGELQPSDRATLDGLSVLDEALDRLRQYKLDRRESEVLGILLSRGYAPGSEIQSVAKSGAPLL
jgi:hypothetical protein